MRSWPFVTILIIAALIGLSTLFSLPVGIGDVDFVQYWSSSRALLMNQDPYDAATLDNLQREVLPAIPEVTRMWNPPAAMTLALPFALLPFDWARSLWWLSLIVLTVLSFHHLVVLLGLSAIERRLAVLLLLTSAPLHSTLSYGQLPPFLLFAWVMALSWYQAYPFRSGLILSLTLLKPHLLFLNYICLVLNRSWRVIAGLLSGFFVISLLPLLLQPAVFSWYLNALESPPLYWINASLGALMQFLAVEAGAEKQSWLLFFRFVPALIAVILFSITFRGRTSTSIVTLVKIVPWSLAFSPYGWMYDQLLLLPTQLLMIRFFVRSHQPLSLFLLFSATLAEALTPGSFGQASSMWYPLFIALLSSGVENQEKTQPVENVSPSSE